MKLQADPAYVVFPQEVKKIAYDLLSDLLNIHRKFDSNRSSRFGGVW